MKTLGIYLHIPFCRQKCAYCDFYSLPAPRTDWMEAYTDVLCRDLERQSEKCTDYTVDTVFFGGGTPTLLPIRSWERIMGTLERSFSLSGNAEITSECNPATADRDLLRSMRDCGINRLSIGLQSIHDRELQQLGRIHRYGEFLQTFEDALSVGFRRISADLMFGIPEQTAESFAQTLQTVCDLQPEHLSVYSLIEEKGTLLGDHPERYRLPDEDTVREMYLSAVKYLRSRGLFQYEISNFAVPGGESRHNLKYWNQESYLGFGPSAYSDFDGKRFGYGRSLEDYLKGTPERTNEEILSERERMNEYVMLRMRLAKGISEKEFVQKFGAGHRTSFQTDFGAKLESYLHGGFVKRTDDGYAFTPEGMLVSNSILSDILDF